jgi:hypothetical protein
MQLVSFQDHSEKLKPELIYGWGQAHAPVPNSI